ncbi:hypothetical protein [endosymbiont of Ridgeia piscesae]|nr:hypothetical protein [endosymbiont of Ridgeia piscesae]
MEPIRSLVQALILALLLGLPCADAVVAAGLDEDPVTRVGQIKELLDSYRGRQSKLQQAKAELDQVIAAHPEYAPALCKQAHTIGNGRTCY